MSPIEYIDLATIAELAGVGRESIKTYHKRATANRAAGNPRPGDLPPEDMRLGRTPGWKRSTIEKWLDARPRASAAVREQLAADVAAARATPPELVEACASVGVDVGRVVVGSVGVERISGRVTFDAIGEYRTGKRLPSELNSVPVTRFVVEKSRA